MRQLVTRVNPVWPTGAAAAKAGGVVIADLIVRVDGTVESVTILGGHDLLRQATSDALKRWRFRPFVVSGKPARVLTLVEVTFPDPAADEERRTYEEYRATRAECRRQLDTPPADPVTACHAAMRAADRFGQERPLERSGAVADYALSLLRTGRPAEALVEYKRATAIRERDSGRDDADVASLYYAVAVTYITLKDLPRRRTRPSPSPLRSTKPRFGSCRRWRIRTFARARDVLNLQAKVKRARGETAAADAVEARAAAIAVRPTSLDAHVLRTVRSVQVIGTGEQQLSDDDVRQIQALAAPGGRPSTAHRGDRPPARRPARLAGACLPGARRQGVHDSARPQFVCDQQAAFGRGNVRAEEVDDAAAPDDLRAGAGFWTGPPRNPGRP